MLNFISYFANHDPLTPENAADRLGFEDDFFDNDDVLFVHIHANDTFIIEQPHDKYWTISGREQFSGTFYDVARALYLDHYISECEDEYTLDGLSDALNLFCEWRDLKPMCAYELVAELRCDDLHNKTPNDIYNIEWLEWFINVWDTVEMRETYEAHGGRA